MLKHASNWLRIAVLLSAFFSFLWLQNDSEYASNSQPQEVEFRRELPVITQPREAVFERELPVITQPQEVEFDSEYIINLPIIRNGDVPKHGFAWPWHGLAKEWMIDELGAGWYYVYAVQARPKFNHRIQYIPMFWADRSPSLKYWGAFVDKIEQIERNLPRHYSGPLLILNECDLPGSDSWQVEGQCDRTPRQSAFLYKGLRESWPYAEIIGPVTSHRDYWKNWEWQKEFYKQITAMGLPPPDVGAIHTYLVDREPPERIINSYLEMVSEWNGPETVWVTEFATCKPARALLYLKFYKESPLVERYSWFGVVSDKNNCGMLIWPNGKLTPVGEVWRDFHKGN